ncbi:MAG TPA: glutamate racemase [Gammaproteobacteria bacterium]
MSDSAAYPVSDPRPIGVFDSGVGGLSVLRHLHARLPHEHLLYVADNAYIPYGDKPASLVRERSFYIAQRLIGLGAKLLVVACNTATAAAIHELRAHYALPIVGMEPGVKPAVTYSRARRVGILATAGTLRSSKFATLLERYGAGAEVILQPCPGLVEQIEQGELHGSETRAMLQRFLLPLQQQQVDTIVLGCTHYPFVQPLIEQIVGPQVRVIDTGPAVARHVEHLLREHVISNLGNAGEVRLFTSGEAAVLQPLFATLWGSAVTLERID